MSPCWVLKKGSCSVAAMENWCGISRPENEYSPRPVSHGFWAKASVCTGNSGAENFAYVIERTAVGVSSADSQLFEKIVGTELSLQSMVVGEAAVVALQHKAFGTVGTAQSRIDGLSGPSSTCGLVQPVSPAGAVELPVTIGLPFTVWNRL